MTKILYTLLVCINRVELKIHLFYSNVVKFVVFEFVIFGKLKWFKCSYFQEFSKLFISMLEERLSHQSSPLVKNIIHEQFCGKYSYVTK